MEHPVDHLAKDAMQKQELDMILKRSTPERRAIYEKLRDKEWFRNTDIGLQKKLMQLPDKGKRNHDRFLEDLSDRPGVMGNVKVERLIDLPHGNFALIPKFEVSRTDQPNMRYTYEYASWYTGPLSGAKGVVFVEKDGATTHFILLNGEKFATGKPQLQAIGGFYDKGYNGIHTITDTIVNEIREELGSKHLEIKKFENLGMVQPDAGLTNNAPELYAATISADDLPKLSAEPVNTDVYELKHGAVIIPIAQLPDIVMTNSDGYFLSTIAKVWAKGIIKPPTALEGKNVGFSPN
jgi:hypothetical protein